MTERENEFECECVSLWVWVCEFVSVSVCEWVCESVCVRAYEGEIIKSQYINLFGCLESIYSEAHKATSVIFQVSWFSNETHVIPLSHTHTHTLFPFLSVSLPLSLSITHTSTLLCLAFCIQFYSVFVLFPCFSCCIWRWN